MQTAVSKQEKMSCLYIVWQDLFIIFKKENKVKGLIKFFIKYKFTRNISHYLMKIWRNRHSNTEQDKMITRNDKKKQ